MTKKSTDEFAGQADLNRVREDLWRRGRGASVMVGSGFSRNGLKVRPDADDIPTWSELTRSLALGLSSESGGSNSASRTSTAATIGAAPSLAQEYENRFGRSQLTRLITESVRDTDFAPGSLHTRLLKLPWRDVYTTNWDTLLERTLPVPGRSYSVVTKADHLPLSASPRIVKLHGSLPGTFPLIVTETDYGGYPKDFAPLVNTVQQGMMETTLVLLGFSGEDPNFRQWLKWVQANLGAAAPKIYLMGAFGFSGPERRGLTARNVVPIDLDLHPQSVRWPASLRHRKAVEWCLLSLEQGEPYLPQSWPSPIRVHSAEVPPDLEPVGRVRSRSPTDEPWRRSAGGSNESIEPQEVSEVVQAWRHNRKLYPQWLVIPFSAASRMRPNTDHWEPVLIGALPKLEEPTARLEALYELVWRRETQLDPLFTELEEAIRAVLTEIDCETQSIGGKEDVEVDWGRVRRHWRALAAALVTDARFEFRRGQFKEWIERLTPFLAEDDDLRQRLCHEECLWALNHQDYEELGGLVETWRPEDADPAWLLRKAALLGELDRRSAALELAKVALESVRRWSDESRSMAGVSREAWSLWLVQAVDPDFEGAYSRLGRLTLRWRELARYRCDAVAEFQSHLGAVKRVESKDDRIPFDLGALPGRTVRFGDRPDPALAALRAIRFVELAGSPTASSGELLNNAAEVLRPYSPEWTTRLTARCATGAPERTYSRTLSRWQIASMPAELARRMADTQNRVVDDALQHLGSPRRQRGALHWRERLAAAIEALSRCVVRLPPEEVERVLTRAQALYRDERISEDHLLAEPVRRLFERTWGALPSSLQRDRVLDLLRLPIAGAEGFVVRDELRYPDPGMMLDLPADGRSFPVPGRSVDNEGAWRAIVEIVNQGLRSGGRARSRAASRLVRLAAWSRLSPEEEKVLAASLWDCELGPEGLPSGTKLRPWVFMVLPEPNPGLAEERLRSSWRVERDWQRETEEKLGDFLGYVGDARRKLPDWGKSLEFTETETAVLTGAVNAWASRALTPVFLPFGDPRPASRRRAIRGLATLLPELSVDTATVRALVQRIRELGGLQFGSVGVAGRIPAFELIPGVLHSSSAEVDSLADLVRIGLGSSEADDAASAASSVVHWLRACSEGSGRIPAPPDSVLADIGVIIVARRWYALPAALEAAAWVFREGSEEHKELLQGNVVEGLRFLAQALTYERPPEQRPFAEFPYADAEAIDVPWLRFQSVQLAIAMAGSGLIGDPVVSGWLQDAAEDPLPEVRFAVEEWRERKEAPAAS